MFWNTKHLHGERSDSPYFAGERLRSGKAWREFKMAKKSSKASFLPLAVAIIAIAVSISIYLMTRSVAHAFTLHLIAYLLTPLCVSICLGWDSISQRIRRGNDPWFSANSKYPLILRIMTVASFFISFPHIVAMATDIAEKLSAQK